MKNKLLITASALALGFAVASTASANPKNKFSEDATAYVQANGQANGRGNDTVEIDSRNTETEVLATNIQNASEKITSPSMPTC